ncbi:hypothetical protein VOLCADRAFT_88625 [Volvox carteri f. nagariensis]|uniref:Uncharacterized protein n=1 Tax=Volvox carteri f. nagariensis TaxID=3068 RepID=D8TPI0_VOLCA|nr:uncharacterized protein VOLCADRAFT_88625 [Volvox carteri f. nagariensis]EFJ50620.1 hypothetical protein VOLCADRAFT_88625 [Volvox carteri f. nagariensis]|eukprot:XP_002948213.1 hypothetical protein VOLCADRAFT_88625 [Volvox carteri f. nagariensis]
MPHPTGLLFCLAAFLVACSVGPSTAAIATSGANRKTAAPAFGAKHLPVRRFFNPTGSSGGKKRTTTIGSSYLRFSASAASGHRHLLDTNAAVDGTRSHISTDMQTPSTTSIRSNGGISSPKSGTLSGAVAKRGGADSAVVEDFATRGMRSGSELLDSTGRSSGEEAEGEMEEVGAYELEPVADDESEVAAAAAKAASESEGTAAAAGQEVEDEVPAEVTTSEEEEVTSEEDNVPAGAEEDEDEDEDAEDEGMVEDEDTAETAEEPSEDERMAQEAQEEPRAVRIPSDSVADIRNTREEVLDVQEYGGEEPERADSLDPEDLARELAGSIYERTVGAAASGGEEPEEEQEEVVTDGSGNPSSSPSNLRPGSDNASSSGSGSSGQQDRPRRHGAGVGKDPCAVAADTGGEAKTADAAVAVAEYSPLFGSPVCDGRGKKKCVAAGLDGKGRGSELFAPNTLYGECPDGQPGSRGYVLQVAVESMTPGKVLRSGELAAIRAAVVCSSGPNTSFVDFFYTSDASMTPKRSWTLLSTVACVPSNDTSDRPAVTNYTSETFLIPEGVLDTTFVARVQLREEPAGTSQAAARRQALPCRDPVNGSGDRDDLVVRVCPAPAGVDTKAAEAGWSDVRGGHDNGDDHHSGDTDYQGVELRAAVVVPPRHPMWGLFAARRNRGVGLG